MYRKIMIWGGLFLLTVTGISWAEKNSPWGKTQYHIENGVLWRGKHPEGFHGIEVPGLLDPSNGLDQWAREVGRIATVGGDAICFNLPKLIALPDGSFQVPADVPARVDKAAGEINWRGFNIICKIFPEGFPDDPAMRIKVAQAVARAFKGRTGILYWIEGQNCRELVQAFHEIAPNLIVMAKEGAPIRVVDQLPAGKDNGGCTVLYNLLPGSIRLDTTTPNEHVIMKPGEDSYNKFERAAMYPAEKQPWHPDNSVLSAAERQDGFIALFDGKTLDGWVILGNDKRGFQVKDGIIKRVEGGGGYLRTRDRYSNFILRLEYRINKGGNSGISLRAPRNGRFSKIGMEYQILGDSGEPPHRTGTASIYDVVAPLANPSRPEGEWNQVEIILDGSHMTAHMNGVLVQDVDLDKNPELRRRLKRGFICLQDHGHPVAFRNIRIKILPDK